MCSRNLLEQRFSWEMIIFFVLDFQGLLFRHPQTLWSNQTDGNPSNSMDVSISIWLAGFEPCSKTLVSSGEKSSHVQRKYQTLAWNLVFLVQAQEMFPSTAQGSTLVTSTERRRHGWRARPPQGWWGAPWGRHTSSSYVSPAANSWLRSQIDIRLWYPKVQKCEQCSKIPLIPVNPGWFLGNPLLDHERIHNIWRV